MTTLARARSSLLYTAGLVGIFVVGAVALRAGTGHSDLSVLAYSCVFGCANALFAVGLVLIYRASRVINFAHASFGLIGAALFYEMVSYLSFPYWAALPIALVASAVAGTVVEFLFIRRFFGSARLIVLVVTIGIGQLLAALAGAVPGLVGDHNFQPGQPRTPFSHLRWQAFPVVFTGDQVFLVLVTVAALGGMIAFFRLSRRGIAVRGAAENADRASLLGINTRTLSTLVWTLGAGLSGLAAILVVPIVGYQGGSVGSSGLGTEQLLIGLAAAVVAGMDNLPMAVVASLGIAVFQEVVFFDFSQSAIVDVALLGLILVALLLRRRRLMRVDEGAVSSWAATEEVRPIPPELAHLPTVRSGVRRLTGLLGVVIVGIPFVLSPSQTSLATSFLIDGMVIVSLVVLTGWGGQVSLGQWALAAVGAVFGGALYGRAGLPFLVALLLGSLSGAAVAVVLGFASLRVRGLYLAVTTLAFAVAMATVGVNRTYFGNLIAPSVNRPSLFSIKTTDERVFYYLCLAALIGVWYAAIGLRRTRTGRVLIAMRENERTAQALGVNLVRTRLATFALSGFIAAFAGVLLAVQEHQVSPDAFGPDQSVNIFLAAVIGGLGSIQGALLGALYFAVVSFVLHGAVAQLLASAVGVLLVLLFFPGGLGALAYAARDAVLRRVAIRRRIWVPSLLPDRLLVEGRGERAPVAPRPDDGEPVPVHYRLPSRIRVAGGSQAGRRWTF
ncbi:MAG TPA: ABC transporter permease [Acidimicrobiales bacterium]|nr:ABC transporter permease [Acidimicrobiales bacterium]